VDTSPYVQGLVDYVRERSGFLFHVTDEAHLPLIAEYGLLSNDQREARGIQPAYPGGNELSRALDADHSLTDYVFLSFTASGVMPKHDDWRRRPVTLGIDPAILLQYGVKIAMGRANHAGTKVYKVVGAVLSEKGIDGPAFEQVMNGTEDINDFRMRSRTSAVHNYEILVPQVVPPQFIVRLLS
jgi:hypothetical protein